MSDEPADPLDDGTESTPEGQAGSSDGELPLEERFRALEQIVAVILAGDLSSADRDDDEPGPPIGVAGTVAPVAETAVADRGGPWNWTGVDEQRRVELAEELHTFVRWLEERYLRHLSVEQYQLPPDWYDNPVVVEILTAVMVARAAVYSDMQVDPSSALSEWHERALWPALDRLRSLRVFHDNKLVPRTRHAATGPDAAARMAAAAARSAELLQPAEDEPHDRAPDARSEDHCPTEALPVVRDPGQ